MSSLYHEEYYPRCVLWGHEQLSRPTTSFARGCKLWSRERRYYEDERHSNMVEFCDRPYLYRQYPEIGKHYPGTWRVVRTAELDEIIRRLTQPTQATTSREKYIKERNSQYRYLVGKEKAKDVVQRARSAAPRLEGQSTPASCGSRSELHFRRNYVGSGRKCKETTWVHTNDDDSFALPAV